MAKKDTKAATPKRLNIYKVVTKLPEGGPGTSPTERTDYVKAKTKAGAIAMVAAEHITADLAQTEDLLKLANITVKGGAQ